MILKAVLYYFLACFLTWTCYYDAVYIDHLGLLGRTYRRFQYLTVIYAHVLPVYIWIAFIAEIARPVRKLRDFLFATVAFPYACIVAGLFWGLYAVDRELVYPKRLDDIFPQWFNHVRHTWIVPIMLADLVLTSHRYPSVKNGISTLVLLSVLYTVNILATKYFANVWLYPVFAVFTPIQFVLFNAFAVAAAMCFYGLGYTLTTAVHPKSQSGEKQKRKHR